MTINEIIAYNIKYQRKLRDLTTAEVARKAGITNDLLLSLEKGETDVPISILEKIAPVLNCTIDVLVKPQQNEICPFKSTEELKVWLVENDFEDSIVLERPDYLGALVGITDNGRLIYNHEKMVECLIEEGMEAEDAVDFVDSDTLRAIPYMGEMAPVVLFEFIY